MPVSGEGGMAVNGTRFESLRAGIPALQRCTYMNTGTSGPLHDRVVARIRELLQHEVEQGAAAPEILGAGFHEGAALKAALSALFGCRSDDLALTQNATQGLTVVAAGYPWQPGDEILTTDQEHVSGLVPWFSLARHRGVVVRVLPAGADPDATVRAFADAITPATRLLAFSHVSYSTGVRLPAERLCKLARERGVLSAIDGAQAAGALAVDLDALGCDFYALPGQKWLMGPDGTGAFYVRPESLERLQPPALGWASVSRYDLQGGYDLFPSARRFETATTNTPLAGGLRAAVELALEIGRERIAGRVLELAAGLKERLARVPGVTVITPAEPERSAGLVSLTVAGVDAETAAQKLWREQHLLCRSIPDPYCLRFSTHAFNTEEELDRAAEAVAGLRG